MLQIDPAFFAQRHDQRLLRPARRLDRHPALDRPLAEDGRLGGGVVVVVVVLQREQERKIRVAGEGPDIRRRGDRTELIDKIVVVLVEPEPGGGDFVLAAILDLGAKAFARGITHVNQPADAPCRRRRQIDEQTQFVPFADGDGPAGRIGEHVGVRLDAGRRRDGLPHGRRFGGRERPVDTGRQCIDRARQRFAQVTAVAGEPDLVAPIHAMLRPLHPAEQHRRMGVVVFIEKYRLRPATATHRPALPPRRSAGFLARCPFAQEDNVRRHLRVGVLLERGVRQPHGADQVAGFAYRVAQMRVLLVERAARRDERDQSAGPHPLGRRDKEIIVDVKLARVELRVERRVVAERHVRDGEVEAVGRQRRFLERLRPDVRVRIKELGEPGGQRVDLNPGELRAGAHPVGHEPEEMPEPARRFEDAAVGESQPGHGRIHRPDHRRRGVVRVQHRGPRCPVFVRREQFLQGGLFGSPLRRLVRRREDLRQPTPAGVADQNRLFVGGRRTRFALDCPQEPDRRNVLLKLLAERTVAQPVRLRDTVVVPIPGYSFVSGRRRIYFSRTSSHAWSCACWGVRPCRRNCRISRSMSDWVRSCASSKAVCRRPSASSSITSFGQCSRQWRSAIRP